MTDLEKIELSIRRLAATTEDSPFKGLLEKLASQIASDEAARRKECKRAPPSV